MPVDSSPFTVETPPVSADAARRRPGPGVIVGVLAAIVIVVWWWWPTFDGRSGRLDVLVLGDLVMQDAEEPVTQRIRQTGRSVEVVALPRGWCSDGLLAEVDAREPAVVVISAGAGGDCAAAVLDDLSYLVDHVVAVVQPGVGPDVSVIGAGASSVVDPERFVGPPVPSLALRCQWWDDCSPDGTVAVRDEGGALTRAGGERLARLIVSEL